MHLDLVAVSYVTIRASMIVIAIKLTGNLFSSIYFEITVQLLHDNRFGTNVCLVCSDLLPTERECILHNHIMPIYTQLGIQYSQSLQGLNILIVSAGRNESYGRQDIFGFDHF